MDLSPEDSLRINVMLNQALQAVRIDESKMVVYGLSDRGEAKVPLNPNCRDEQYVKKVKEVISSHVLGSPGGYPIYLRRWTRMGQARDQSLEKLLQLGEPEAVVAVVHATGLTDELARRAWWSMQSSINARCMLQRESVVQGEMGAVLAEFLIEFLPFEEEAKDIVESVRLVLQPGLIDDETRQSIWAKGQRKNAYLVGFLKTQPDNVPEATQAHPQFEKINAGLQTLAEAGNPFASQLLRLLSESGQAFLKTAHTVLKKPTNQDVVVALFEAIESYFTSVRPKLAAMDNMQQITEASAKLCQSGECSKQLATMLEATPETRPLVEAMLNLSLVSVSLLNPIFGRTDAVGSVMRRKIEPVTTLLFDQFATLMGTGRKA